MHYLNLSRKAVSALIFGALLVLSVHVYSSPVRAVDQPSYDTALSNCQEVQAKLQEKTDDFTQKRQQHIDKYQQITDLSVSIQSTLSQSGYDTAILSELQPGLTRRTDEFAQVSQVFLTEIKDATDSACRDEASFLQELEEARESLKQVQTSSDEVKQYVQQILLKAVKDVVAEGANS